MLGTVNVANAAIFNFSFNNENCAVSGTVSGTITLPDGDDTFAATDVTITTLPAGLGLPAAPVNALAGGSVENSFNVIGGAINLAATSFLGLINGLTALAFSTTLNGGAGTFLDALNGNNFGATGVLDTDSSSLTFSSNAVSTPEPTSIITLIGVGVLGVASKLKKKA